MFVELLKPFLGKPAGEHLHVAAEEGNHLIASGIARAVTDDPLQPVIAKGVESALSGFTRGLDAIIAQTLKQFADAQSQARKHSVPAIFGPGGEGDPKRSFGDYCLAVSRNDRGYLERHYGSQFVNWQSKAALGEASGATGGYTVPPEFYQGIMQLVAEQTFIRPRAFIMPMASATLQIPYLDVTTAQSAGVSPFFGGLQMSWTAEAQTRTETEPAFKQMELKAWELSGYSVSSNVLLQDSVIGLEKFLFTLFAKAIGWFEEYAFLQGNGVGKPQGMVGANAAIATGNNGGKTGRQTANSITFGDVAVMWSKLLPASYNTAIWACSPTAIPQLIQLQDGANRAIFLQIGSDTQGAITSKPNWTLLGRPIFITEKLPALGTKGDLCLLDPSLYVIGDRMQIEVAASEHVNFLNKRRTVTGQEDRTVFPTPGICQTLDFFRRCSGCPVYSQVRRGRAVLAVPEAAAGRYAAVESDERVRTERCWWGTPTPPHRPGNVPATDVEHFPGEGITMRDEDADRHPEQHKERGTQEQVAGFLAFRQEYVEGATAKAKEEVRGRLRDASIKYKGRGGEGVVQYPDEKPFPLFIIPYAEFQPEQVQGDLADLLVRAGQEPCLVVFITPPDAAEGLESLLLERGRFSTEASVYIWHLDLEGRPGDWKWTAGRMIPVFGDGGTRLGRPEAD